MTRLRRASGGAASAWQVRSRALLCAVCILASVVEARADWFINPFFGTTFAGQSPVPQFDLDPGAVTTKHWLFGGSAGWLSDNVLGAEVDFARVPAIFEHENVDNLVTGSRAMTLSGNLIVAAPLILTRESLRPYLVGGLGLVNAAAEHQRCLFECVTLNALALQVGGGALGFVSDRAGVRFDLRQTRSLSRADSLLGDRRAKLSFWRATVGVVIRY